MNSLWTLEADKCTVSGIKLTIRVTFLYFSKCKRSSISPQLKCIKHDHIFMVVNRGSVISPSIP